jgi:hypothetical protein
MVMRRPSMASPGSRSTWITTIVVSVALSVLLLFSAVQKLEGSPAVVDSYRQVGVAPARLPALAAILVAGTAGVLGGLVWAPLGVAAAACLVAYFVIALGAHIRHRQLGNVATPVVLLALATTTGVLRVVTM